MSLSKYILIFQTETELRPSTRYLSDEREVEASTNKIKRQIEQINKRLSENEKATLIMEANTDNPPGYDCTNEIMEINEVSFTDQIRCYNTTEEVSNLSKV